MIDLASETLLTFAEAAKRVPPIRDGRPTHVATLHRWALHGTRGVHLEFIRLGGRMLTSTEALQRYGERLTEAISKGGLPPVAIAHRPPTARRKSLERAERDLTAAGF